MEPPQRCCCSTSVWSGAEIVLLAQGRVGAVWWGQGGGWGGVVKRGSRGEICIMAPMTQFASLNNLHPEGLQKFYPVSRPCSCMCTGGIWPMGALWWHQPHFLVSRVATIDRTWTSIMLCVHWLRPQNETWHFRFNKTCSALLKLI